MFLFLLFLALGWLSLPAAASGPKQLIVISLMVKIYDLFLVIRIKLSVIRFSRSSSVLFPTSPYVILREMSHRIDRIRASVKVSRFT